MVSKAVPGLKLLKVELLLLKPMPRQITRLRIQRRLAIATARQQARAEERR